MERFIVRAEIRADAASIVTYGYDLTPTSVFVVAEWQAPLGTEVDLRLSLPRALPVVARAKVAGFRATGAPGELGGLELEIEAAARPSVDAFLAELHARPERAPSYRALLVEDNSLTRDVFAFSASRFFGGAAALAMDHADTAERAWDLLAASKYDVVIVDYFLPTADGAQLIARLRADPRLGGTPVVAISAGGRVAREATMSAGADLFIDKPIAFKELFTTLQLLAPGGADDVVAPPKRTILVLDDSPFALAMSQAALESAGFTVRVAEDLATFERERAACEPDLIIIDVQMPEAYGDDVAATLLGGGIRVPVLLFSSIEETELARRSAEAQASGYIWKGAGISELVRRCKELLEHTA